MDPSPSRSNLWSDAASTTVSAHLTTGYSRLRAMALAYATPGCSLHMNAALLADTVGGLEWMHSNRYNTVIAQYDNWWDWEIGVPMHLTDTAVLLYSQHGYHPYTEGYGAALLGTMAPVLTWLAGSAWAVTDPAQTNLYRWVYDSFEPLIYRGAAWDLVRGREVSRSGSTPQGTGHSILQNILRVSQFAPAADSARMRSMVKYWALSDTVRNFTNSVPLQVLADAKALMADSTTVPRGELLGHYHFGEMDRVIHLRPGYGFGLSLFSSRIANFESINSENMCGWYTGDGMTTLYNDQLDHYSDSYWPTVNPYRLPGQGRRV